MEVASNKAIWLGPLKDSSPYNKTFMANSIIKLSRGNKARKNGISLLDLIILFFVMILYLLHSIHNHHHIHTRIHIHIHIHIHNFLCWLDNH